MASGFSKGNHGIFRKPWLFYIDVWDIERLKHCVFKGKIYSQCFSASTWEGFLTIHPASGLWGIVPLSTNTSVQDFYEHQRIPVRFGQHVGQNSGPSTWRLMDSVRMDQKPILGPKRPKCVGHPSHLPFPVDSEVRHSTRKPWWTIRNPAWSDRTNSALVESQNPCVPLVDLGQPWCH